MTYYQYYDSPIGTLGLTSDGEALTGVWFEKPTIEYTEESLSIFDETKSWLDCYFAGKNPGALPKIRFIADSEFRLQVWEIIRETPYGELITYGDIAKKIAGQRGIARMSAQAVGGAVGHNPLPVIVPCHRVIGTNGNLTGYGGGMDRKVMLLKLEGFDMSKFTLPKK